MRLRTCRRRSGFAGSDRAGQPASTTTHWNTGSIAKTVTAAQILRLAERGSLDLDEPAANRVPKGLNTNGATIRDLLRMRSGLLIPGARPAVRSRTATATTSFSGMSSKGSSGFRWATC